MQPYEQLEQRWAEFNELDPAGMVVCASGTAALHLTLEAFQLPPGNEVVVPDFTMVACPRAVTLARLEPVFVDCDDNLNMDPALAVTPQEAGAAAIMSVHVYGRCCDMNWRTTAKTHTHIKVIEDLAEAHGIKPHPSADAACWSFYKNKVVAGEEGGAVWFRDFGCAKLARQLRSLGFTDAHDFDHVPRGHNYRMSNAHARLILDSLGKYRANLAARRWIESTYEKHCPPEWRMPPRDVPWVYDLRVRGMTSEMQGKVIAVLNANGIAARHAFKPMHTQREYCKCKAVGPKREWCACMAAKEVLYLPIQPGATTEADCRRAFDIIEDSLG